jgi:DNA-binding GntR family transcriptional regulator
LARIRARIYSGEFKPGVKLSIDGLAAELGVSRTPVRDAFGQLEREGLVTITSRVGVFVRRLTRSEAEDIYRIKEAVEPLLARWAAERPSAAQRAEYRDRVVAGLAASVARGGVQAPHAPAHRRDHRLIRGRIHPGPGFLACAARGGRGRDDRLTAMAVPWPPWPRAGNAVRDATYAAPR